MNWIRFRVKSTLLFSTAVLLLGVAGCTFWHNFSTYFNTIYLAQAHLDFYEAQQSSITTANPNGAIAVLNHRWLDEEYDMRELAIREGTPQPIPPTFSQTLSATKQISNIHLDSAIILGSKVLADKKGSKYIEDALFIVGKAQFYKNDFTGARRKFLELLYKYPETKYGAEVQVLLSRSMLANRQLDTARASLEKALDFEAKSENKQSLSEIHRAYAEYFYAKNPDTLVAIANELRQAENGLTGEELARLAYQEGAVDYFNSDWSNAERAFRTVYELAKDDWLGGEGHIAHALVLRREEKFNDASAELRDVIAKVRFGGSHAAARYELAYTEDLAARKAVGGNLRSTDTLQKTSNEVDGQTFKAKYFPRLRDSYYTLDTAYKNSSAVIIARARFRESELYREMGEYDSAAKLAAGLIGTRDFSSPRMNDFVSQRANSLSSFSRWWTELARVDSIEQSVKQKPVAKNEDSTVHLAALKEVLGTRWKPDLPLVLSKEDSLHITQAETRLRHGRNPAPKLTITDTVRFIDSLHFRAVNAHYQIGRAYETFTEIPQARDEYQSALAYHFVIPDTAKASLRAQTIYAWMQLESREKNQAVADSLLKILLSRYGQTIFAQQARTLYALDGRNTPGEAAYQAAYTVLRAQGLDAAKPPFMEVVTSYKQEDVAPRSLFAIGETYEEHERYDSAVVYYRRILRDYPFSAYALALRPRLADANVNLPHAPPRPVDPTTLQNGAAVQTLQMERTQALQQELQKQEEAAPGSPRINMNAPAVNVGDSIPRLPPLSRSPNKIIPPKHQ